MKDKEKQIEEMANIIQHTEFVDISWYEAEKIAEELYKHYKPKLPEDSVVLSRGEHASLVTRPNLHTAIDVFTVRKETVEKLYNYADMFLFDDPTDKIYFKEFVKEEFGVEIKE